MNATYRIASGRASLAADVVGGGSPVVFLHAGVCDRRMWRAQLYAIGAGYRAIAYDRRGFGETVADTEAFSSVADLMEVIAALADGGPAILVGSSEGGRIAIDAALQHPSAVRGLVLIAPSISGSPDVSHPPEITRLLERLVQAETAGDRDRVNALEAHLWLDGPLEPEGRVTGTVRRLFLDMNAIALRSSQMGTTLDRAVAFERLNEIVAPSLVVCGELDFPFIQDRCEMLSRKLPNAMVRAIAGTAHLPNLERPEAVTDIIVDFAARLDRFS